MLTWISPQQHQCQEVFSLDGVVSMTTAEVFQEVVHAFLVIGRNTITIADMDPGSVALNDRAGSTCWKDWTFYKPLSLPGHLDVKWPPLRYLKLTWWPPCNLISPLIADNISFKSHTYSTKSSIYFQVKCFIGPALFRKILAVYWKIVFH